MKPNTDDEEKLSFAELNKNYKELQNKYQEIISQKSTLDLLFFETSHKLQVYSASIKAAVSSLLSYDFFWDSSNQHEFLETIDDSIEQINNLVTLLSLALRSEANKLEIRPEPHNIQEIIYKLQNEITNNFNIKLDIDILEEGDPVVIDYNYMFLALKLFLNVVNDVQPYSNVHIKLSEIPENCLLEFQNINSIIINLLQSLIKCDKAIKQELVSISTDNILRIFVVLKLFCLQGIDVKILTEQQETNTVLLYIPIHKLNHEHELSITSH